MTQNQFDALYPPERDSDAPAEGKPRDSKRHEPHAPKQGREYDRNSVKGERTRPPKQGYGRGNQGNPKDTRIREETEEQKARRELREAEAREEMEKHQEYLQSIQGYEGETIVADVKVDVQKNHQIPTDIQEFAKKQPRKERKDRDAKKDVIML